MKSFQILIFYSDNAEREWTISKGAWYQKSSLKECFRSFTIALDILMIIIASTFEISITILKRTYVMLIILLAACPWSRLSPAQLSSSGRCSHSQPGGGVALKNWQFTECPFGHRPIHRVYLIRYQIPCLLVPSCRSWSFPSGRPSTSSCLFYTLPCPFPKQQIIRTQQNNEISPVFPPNLPSSCPICCSNWSEIFCTFSFWQNKIFKEGVKKAASPVLAESFRFLWRGCLWAHEFRFSGPAIWIWKAQFFCLQTSFSPFSRSNIVTIPFSCSFLSSCVHLQHGWKLKRIPDSAFF